MPYKTTKTDSICMYVVQDGTSHGPVPAVACSFVALAIRHTRLRRLLLRCLHTLDVLVDHLEGPVVPHARVEERPVVEAVVVGRVAAINVSVPLLGNSNKRRSPKYIPLHVDRRGHGRHLVAVDCLAVG